MIDPDWWRTFFCFEMTGVDFSREYIDVARASAAEASVAPEFLICDMREFTSGEPFDAAFCYFGSFGYFSKMTTRSSLVGPTTIAMGDVSPVGEIMAVMTEGPRA